MVLCVQVGSIDVNVDRLSAYLYLQTGDRHCGPLYDPEEDGDDELEAARSYDLAFYGPQEDAEDIDVNFVKALSFAHAMARLVTAVSKLDDSADEADIQTIFYEEAKRDNGGDGKSIREFFKLVYVFLMHSWSGPRFGQFVKVQGIDGFVQLVEDRLSNPILIPMQNL